jgi:hypothetical protein
MSRSTPRIQDSTSPAVGTADGCLEPVAEINLARPPLSEGMGCGSSTVYVAAEEQAPLDPEPSAVVRTPGDAPPPCRSIRSGNSLAETG